jgi:hypothetical protein
MSIQNIDSLIKLLPEDYEKSARETKAIQRCRGVKSAKNLLKTQLTYLKSSISMKGIAAYARSEGLGELSDVSFMKRLAGSGEWFKVLLSQIDLSAVTAYEKPDWLKNYNVLAIDASKVTTKGAIKKTFLLHYSLDLFGMCTHEFKITDEKTGEKLTNFNVREGDLILADRAYATKSGIFHCMTGGGSFVMRLKNKAFKLFDSAHNEISLLENMQSASETEPTDFPVFIENDDGGLQPLRICALRKTAEAAQKQKQDYDEYESKKGKTISAQTRETGDFIFVITNLPDLISAKYIMSLYRYRWQVELYFKRLKTLLGFGDIMMKTAEHTLAWLNGKMLVAVLTENMLAKAGLFPPEREI